MQFELHRSRGLFVAAALTALLVSHVSAANTSVSQQAPPNIIFDTDIWSDIDDALALAMLHALHDRGELRFVAVTISTGQRDCATFVDLVDHFYGHPGIPIGLVRGGIDVQAFRQKTAASIAFTTAPYTQLISDRKRPDGSWIYPRRISDGAQPPDATALLRKVLAAQPDESVVMIQVGYSTNLARLLESKADAVSALNGRDLIKRKVRLLSVMAGNFADFRSEGGQTVPKGSREFNLMMDAPAAQRLFSEWPTQIVASGVEIGSAMAYPRISIERDYAYVKDHPIAEAYRLFSVDLISTADGKTQKTTLGWPYDRPTFDLTSVLYAARPDRDYFSLSKPGRITVLPDGRTRFEESEKGRDRYLIVNEEQKTRTLEAMMMLASQPPARIP